MPSGALGVRRFARVERTADNFSVTWWDRFPGGGVTYRLHSTADVDGRFTAELPTLLRFASREELRQALRQRSDGRLQLDPRKHHEPFGVRRSLGPLGRGRGDGRQEPIRRHL